MLSQIRKDNEELRTEAEYWKKESIEYENIVARKNAVNLSEVASFLIGPFGSAFNTDNYIENGEYRYVRGQDVKPFILQDSDNRYMPASDFLRLKKYALKENDVLVSVVGTLGNACIVNKKDLPAIFSCKSTVIRTGEKLNPLYLVSYLNSKYGRTLLIRNERGAIQKGLNLSDLQKLLVPIPTDGFQQQIASMVQQAHAKLEESKALYQQAQTLLNDELNINIESDKTPNVNIKTLSQSFFASGRLDAEYYQRKYDDIEKAIVNYKGGWTTIEKEIQYIFTGEYSEEYNKKKDGLVFYIRSLNMKDGRIEKDDNYYVNKSNFKKEVNTGDIITARVGTIGVFAEIDETLNQAVCSDNIICFHLPEKFNSTAYTLLFNSKFMYELVDRLARGSVQQRLNQETFKSLPIPILPESLQRQISALVQKSFALKAESKQLLEDAKMMVEREIEK